MKIAALVVLLLLPAPFIYRHMQPDPLESAVSTSLQDIYAAPELLRGSQHALPEQWSTFIIAYEANKFEQAQKILTNFHWPESHRIMVDYYSALCLLYSSKPDYGQAGKLFEGVRKSDSRYREQSLWFLALCELKLGHEARAKILLEEIVTSNLYNKEQAAKVLDLLTLTKAH